MTMMATRELIWLKWVEANWTSFVQDEEIQIQSISRFHPGWYVSAAFYLKPYLCVRVTISLILESSSFVELMDFTYMNIKLQM